MAAFDFFTNTFAKIILPLLPSPVRGPGPWPGPIGMFHRAMFFHHIGGMLV